jgi:hypothetical protein
MSGSTQTFSEYNGAGAATETPNRAEANFKRVDDSTTAYTASPINSTNNENSMTKYWALKFAGVWNSLSGLAIKINSNAPATGLAIVGAVVTAGSTPSTVASGDPAFSTTGLAVNFVDAATPYGAGTASTTAGGTIFAQCVRSQLQTLSTYAGGPGDIAPLQFLATWTES